MAQYYTVPTTIGQAKLANAVALGIPIEIVEMAVGDGGGTLPDPDSSRTALINELRRAQINASETDPDNPSWIVIEQVIPPDIGGWTIREVGVFDADGDMIAYGNYPETYKPVLSEGSGRTQTIRFVMQVSDTAAVTLKVDPSIVLATRGYVDDALDAHEQSRNHPAATTGEQGMTRYATSEETRQGNSTNRATHPAGVKAAIDQHKGEDQAHTASQITLDTGFPAFGGANNVQTLLAMLGTASRAGDASEANKGVVQIATAAEAQALSSLIKVLTPATLDAAFRGANQSLTSGDSHQDLPGGLIIQMFTREVSGGDTTVDFPFVFPSRCYGVVPGYVESRTGDCEYPQVLEKTGSFFRVVAYSQNDDDGGVKRTGTFVVSWIALGV